MSFFEAPFYTFSSFDQKEINDKIFRATLQSVMECLKEKLERKFVMDKVRYRFWTMWYVWYVCFKRYHNIRFFL